jgi:hypothetical protein
MKEETEFDEIEVALSCTDPKPRSMAGRDPIPYQHLLPLHQEEVVVLVISKIGGSENRRQ